MNTIGFPGLGIKDFNLDPIAFSPFGIDIAWYGIIITCGIILATAYAFLRAKRDKLIFDDLLDIAFATVIPGIIGARLYYVFFDWLKNPDKYQIFMDIINIRKGGLAIYGGLIFGALGCLIMLKIKRIHIIKFFDCMAPGVMIAQALGRWGNFFNAEAYGTETTLPWRMRLTFNTYAIEVHPTFLYESLWNVTGFCFIHFLFNKKKKYDGQILLLYVAWYGLGRMMIEGLRTDSLYVGNTGIRISQIVALVCLIAGGALLIYFALVPKKTAIADCIYLQGTDKYNKVMGIDTVSEKEKDSKDSPAENTESINEKSPDPTDESGKESNNE